MCAVMLPDGRWTHVPRTAALRGVSSPGGAGRLPALREHPDDARALALLVAHDAHGEPLLLEQ